MAMWRCGDVAMWRCGDERMMSLVMCDVDMVNIRIRVMGKDVWIIMNSKYIYVCVMVILGKK